MYIHSRQDRQQTEDREREREHSLRASEQKLEKLTLRYITSRLCYMHCGVVWIDSLCSVESLSLGWNCSIGWIVRVCLLV